MQDKAGYARYTNSPKQIKVDLIFAIIIGSLKYDSEVMCWQKTFEFVDPIFERCWEIF